MRGQRVSAGDRLYRAEELPILIVWRERDPLIPAAHRRSRPRERLRGTQNTSNAPKHAAIG